MAGVRTATAQTTAGGLRSRIDSLAARAQHVVGNRRGNDPNPDDPLRGLHITDVEVDALLAALVPEALTTRDRDDDGFDDRLKVLAARFGLSPIDVDILLTAAAPDFDPRFEAIYGYLNDDVSRRRASVRLALELLGASPVHVGARSRLEADAPLLRGRLVAVDDPDRPFLSRALRVPDRVISFLLGGTGVDDRLRPLLAADTADTAFTADASDPRVTTAIRRGVRLCYLLEQPGTSGCSTAAAACREAGLNALVLDTARLPAGEGEDAVALGVRDAALLGAGLVVGPVETLAVDAGWLAAAAWSPVPIIVVGTREWNPEWSTQSPVVVELRVAAADVRLAQWRRALGATSLNGELETAVGHFRLAPDGIARAVAFASVNAAAAGATVDLSSLRAGARAAGLGRLEQLATRYEPSCGFDDLIVPPDVERPLRDVIARIRHRELVLGTWGMARHGGDRSGVTALFTGPPGTGKTLAARVIAGELGLDLYIVDLATVVDKYIGETEKNLDRIFSAAEGINGVLLFDEADALFGKRSEVSDAKDRHANIEVAYLLQRMEHFQGVAILTSNLRGNIDPAFVRRLDCIVAFPEPQEDARAALWRHHLPPSLPVADDVDVAWLGKTFLLTGGSIRNAVLSAAYAAATAGRTVGMPDIARAVASEYRKVGRLCSPEDFGRWHELVA